MKLCVKETASFLDNYPAIHMLKYQASFARLCEIDVPVEVSRLISPGLVNLNFLIRGIRLPN